MTSTSVHVIPTPAGDFIARFSGDGLCALDFPGRSRAKATPGSPVPARWLKLTTDAILTALRGKSPRRLPPLDLGEATSFQRRVWQELIEIPPGETRSYAELAKRLGSPRAARAVGGACGANPIPLLIPCHRVLAAGGRLGGFSCGIEWKVRLLSLEGSWPA